MPRNVRNFWIEAEVDGRKTPIKFGPTGKDGGFHLIVYIRNQGEAEKIAGIEGDTSRDGKRLILWVNCGDQEIKVIRQR